MVRLEPGVRRRKLIPESGRLTRRSCRTAGSTFSTWRFSCKVVRQNARVKRALPLSMVNYRMVEARFLCPERFHLSQREETLRHMKSFGGKFIPTIELYDTAGKFRKIDSLE